jgi:hypothetical protein
LKINGTRSQTNLSEDTDIPSPSGFLRPSNDTSNKLIKEQMNASNLTGPTFADDISCCEVNKTRKLDQKRPGREMASTNKSSNGDIGRLNFTTTVKTTSSMEVKTSEPTTHVNDTTTTPSPSTTGTVTKRLLQRELQLN